jgi:hypothetical protein
MNMIRNCAACLPGSPQFPRQANGVIWGLKNPKGQTWLLADDYAADVILDQWETTDCQLVVRRDVNDEWHAAGPATQHLLRTRAARARRGRQSIQGEMLP